MDAAPKLFVTVGGSGRGHPLIITLSILNGLELFFAPAAWMKKRVLVVPVVAAVWMTPGD
jgi:hypothetical protein